MKKRIGVNTYLSNGGSEWDADLLQEKWKGEFNFALYATEGTDTESCRQVLRTSHIG